ncbi:MAG TPA: hypothetical protein VLH36_13945 [Steroidobacteraceae bacterium]|nr:hypothetical protein [Steroidobacteraceae bacterium]
MASYGEQLSVVMDVLHELLDQGKGSDETRDKFRARREQIEKAKEAFANNVETEAEAGMKRLHKTDPEAYARLLKRLNRHAG